MDSTPKTDDNHAPPSDNSNVMAKRRPWNSCRISRTTTGLNRSLHRSAHSSIRFILDEGTRSRSATSATPVIATSLE